MSSDKPRVGIFVATMTGLAEMCGEEIEAVFAVAGVECQRHLMDGLGATSLEPFDLLVVVSSTYGHGEIPDNGQVLFNSIASGIDLTDKHYAVFALGDRTYSDTFCAAGENWDRVLQGTGASRIVELERHDASGGTLAEDAAAEWASKWVNRLCRKGHAIHTS